MGWDGMGHGGRHSARLGNCHVSTCAPTNDDVSYVYIGSQGTTLLRQSRENPAVGPFP